MSTETFSPDLSEAEQDGNEPGVGGTSQEEFDPAVSEEEGDQETGAEGVSPEETDEAEPEEGKGTKAEAVDPQEYEYLKQRITLADNIAEIVTKDPERRKIFDQWAAEDRGESQEQGLREAIFSTVDKRFQPEERDAIKGLFEPLLKTVEEQKKIIQSMQPTVAASQRVMISQEFSSALEQAGVPRAVQNSKDFQKFLASERRDADFNRDVSSRPRYAGKNLGRAWMARGAQTSGWKAQNDRLRAVKNGALNAGPESSRGAKKAVIIEDDGSGDVWNHDVLAAYLKNGTDVPVQVRRRK